jgi:DNA-directed RNA polymerase specialized sigma subunit
VTVPLVDIRDVRGYVARVVERKFSETPASEREELVSEGVALLYALHGKWEPERCASFSDFASTYLPLRLIDYWRREMRQRNIARRNGTDQRYVYSGVSSLDQLSEAGMELACYSPGVDG